LINQRGVKFTSENADAVRGEQFDLPARDWWSLTVRGEQLALHLLPERAQINATLDCMLEFDFYLDSENYTLKTDLPLELSILVAFVHDEEESEFYLSVRKGQISITNVVYPNGLISELVEMIFESIVPHIPISGIPVDFDFPDTEAYGEPEAKLMLSGVTVDDLYINLDFHIKSNFLPSRKPSAAPTVRTSATNEESHSTLPFEVRKIPIIFRKIQFMTANITAKQEQLQ
jgi:hypothetical protein